MREYIKVSKNLERAKEYFTNELAYTTGPIELKHLIENHLDEFHLIDVRAYEDYLEGHIPFAVHLPADKINDNLDKLSRDKVNIVYCYSIVCHLGKKCALSIIEKGYPAMELTGGFASWKEHGLEITKEGTSDYNG
jgi:rhodanese-related sulfurtransferase